MAYLILRVKSLDRSLIKSPSLDFVVRHNTRSLLYLMSLKKIKYLYTFYTYIILINFDWMSINFKFYQYQYLQGVLCRFLFLFTKGKNCV